MRRLLDEVEDGLGEGLVGDGPSCFSISRHFRFPTSSSFCGLGLGELDLPAEVDSDMMIDSWFDVGFTA